MAGEDPVVLSQEEKYQILYFMGYTVTDPVASIQLGFPASTQASFLVSGSMERLPPAAIGRIRSIVANLERFEALLAEAPGFLIASRVGEIDINLENPTAIETEIIRWTTRLAETIGAPYNPLAERFRNMGKAPLNIDVQHC